MWSQGFHLLPLPFLMYKNTELFYMFIKQKVYVMHQQGEKTWKQFLCLLLVGLFVMLHNFKVLWFITSDKWEGCILAECYIYKKKK